MKLRAFCLFLCLSFSSFGATLIIAPEDFGLMPTRQTVTVTNITNPTFFTNGIGTQPSKDYMPTNHYGTRSNLVLAAVHAGSYRVVIGPYTLPSKTSAFMVPDTTNTYELSALATNGNTIGNVNGIWLNTNSIVGGSNCLLTYAGTTITINNYASGGGSGASTNYNVSNTVANAGVATITQTTNLNIGTNFSAAILEATNLAGLMDLQRALDQAGLQAALYNQTLTDNAVQSNSLLSSIASTNAAGTNSSLAALQSAQAAQTISNATFLSTNTIGAQVNALTAGMLKIDSGFSNTGVSNRNILSNLVANGVTDIYIPAGTYAAPSASGVGLVIGSNNAPVTFTGDNGKTVFTNAGTSGVVFDAQAGGCVFKGLTFVSGTTNLATVGTTRIWINMNAVGFPKVEDCNFLNISATAIYVGGDPGITLRSNHCLIANNVFSNCYNAIVTGTNNTFEYCSILNNRMSVIVNDGISGGSANCLISGNNINGWKDSSGGLGTPTSTGIRWMSNNGRGHSKFIGNIVNHHLYDLVISNLTTSTDWIGNDFSGGASNVIVNCTDQTFLGNRFQPYGGTIMTGCSRMTFSANRFETNMFGFSKGNYIGYPNTFLDGTPNTNDFISATNIVGVLPQETLPPVVITNNSSGVTFANANISSPTITGSALIGQITIGNGAATGISNMTVTNITMPLISIGAGQILGVSNLIATNGTILGKAVITNVSAGLDVGGAFNVLITKLQVNASGQTILGDGSETANGAGIVAFATGSFGWGSGGSTTFNTTPDTKLLRGSIGNVTVVSNLNAMGFISATNGFVSLSSNTLAPLAITFPATTANWTNTTGRNIFVFIDNTAVTGTAVKVNGTTVYSGLSLDLLLPLQPNDFFSETYTIGTPTATIKPF